MKTALININFVVEHLRVWPLFLCGISVPPYFFQEETRYTHMFYFVIVFLYIYFLHFYEFCIICGKYFV